MVILKQIRSIIMICALTLTLFAGLAPPTHGENVAVAGIVTTETSGLNVRESPSRAGAWITSLKRGTFIRLHTYENGWWKVEYTQGQYGYCDAQYITVHTAETATVQTLGSPLNVRTSAGTAYTVADKIPNGTEVIILAESHEWMYILYHGVKTGYVSADYIATESEPYRAVALQVPCYRQKDSRWSSVKLGQSGKTLGKIGCTTTCLAMTESYRTGKTVTPKTMASTLSYDSTGNLYWPTRYENQFYNESEALQLIYNELAAGRPVLYGSKTRSGKSHWVVVTGFSGNTLSAENFTIHDPGSNYRTTLQDHIDAYGVFYKVVTYTE